MAGSDVDQTRAARRGFAQLPAFFLHRPARNFCAEQLEDNRGADISGIFRADAIAGIEKEARYEIEGLLRAGDDGDLIGSAIHAARGVEVISDSLAERQLSPRIATQQEICRDFAETAAATCAHSGGEEIQGRQVGAKGSTRAGRKGREQVDAFGVGGNFSWLGAWLLLRLLRLGDGAHLE